MKIMETGRSWRGLASKSAVVAAIVLGTVVSVGVPANAAPALDAAGAGATDSATVKRIQTTAKDVYTKISATKDPERAYNELSSADRAAFDAYYLPASSENSITLTALEGGTVAPGTKPLTYQSEAAAMAAVAASTACWIGTSKYTMKAALGNAIWDTWTEGRWCGNGSSVTSAQFNRSWATIAAVGWRDAGQIGAGSGIANNQARMWSQRRMILGSGGWDVQTQQPCNRLNGYANGGASQTWSCSIA